MVPWNGAQGHTDPLDAGLIIMKKIQFQALELDFFFCYVLLLLKLECLLDHIN